MAETKDLAEILALRDKDKYANIINRAAVNGYHDFKFDSIPGHPEYAECNCPKMQLVDDLSKYPELSDVRNDVMNGVYDESADETDAHTMRLGLLDENTGDSLFSTLGLKVPTKEERQQHQNKKHQN